jgi:hypothetical protein
MDMCVNIRDQIGFQGRYAEINREERNYAAILYAALLQEKNLKTFMDMVGASTRDIHDKDYGMYFEYAFLRDLWNQIRGQHANQRKRQLILSHLQLSNQEEVEDLSIRDFNQYFGVSGNPSNRHIQSPGVWSIRKYHPHIVDDEDFYKVCTFKWSFNIKPDLVIHLNRNKAICVEIKYTAGEGVYPSSGVDKKIFRKRGLSNVKQTELQQYMMEELLGFKTNFVFLVYKPSKSDIHTILTWAEVFEYLDIDNLPNFANVMIGNVLDDFVS